MELDKLKQGQNDLQSELDQVTAQKEKLAQPFESCRTTYSENN